MTVATAEKAKTEKYKNPLAIKGHGKEETLKRKKVMTSKALQVRDDTSAGYDVDVNRAQEFADHMVAMKEKGKSVFGKDGFPRIKVMRVTDCPGHKGETVDIVWDGHHTIAGCEIAKIEDVDAVVWEGTYHQAMMASATVANREHERNGKPLSHKDKIRAIHLAAKAIMETCESKKDWPSNRELAELIPCSHTLVGTEDPFGRRKEGSKSREEINAQKRLERQAAKAPATPNGKPRPAVFEIVLKSTGQVLATIEGRKTGEEDSILDEYHAANPARPKTDFVVREKSGVLPKPGTEKDSGGPRFDWSGVEGSLGYVIRGNESLAEMFALSKTPEYKEVVKALDVVATAFKKWKAAHGPKRKD